MFERPRITFFEISTHHISLVGSIAFILLIALHWMLISSHASAARKLSSHCVDYCHRRPGQRLAVGARQAHEVGRTPGGEQPRCVRTVLYCMGVRGVQVCMVWGRWGELFSDIFSLIVSIIPEVL